MNTANDGIGEFLLEVKKDILLYVPPILLFVGIVGNFLSFLVFRSIAKKNSTYCYLTALSVTDIIVLFVGLLRIWIDQLTSTILQNSHEWLCKLTAFLGYTSSNSSTWLIVAVTADRVIAVCHAMKASSMCRLKKARLVIFSIFGVNCILNSHFLWTLELQKVNQSSFITKFECDAVPLYRNFIQQVLPWIDAASYSFIPIIIVFILNSRIVKHLYSTRHDRELLSSITSSATIYRKPTRNLSWMLLILTITFVVTTLPVTVMLIIGNTYNMTSSLSAKLDLAKTIAELLMYGNHSLNFIFYCVTGKVFREQFLSIFCQRCRRSETNMDEYVVIPMQRLTNKDVQII